MLIRDEEEESFIMHILSNDGWNIPFHLHRKLSLHIFHEGLDKFTRGALGRMDAKLANICLQVARRNHEAGAGDVKNDILIRLFIYLESFYEVSSLFLLFVCKSKSRNVKTLERVL